MSYLVPFFLLLAAATASAQPIRFEKLFRIDGYSAVALAMRPVSDGGYIIAGRFDIYDSTSTAVPDSRALLLRVDGAGNVLWYRMYGASHVNYLVSVHQTSDGGFVACGTSDGSYTGKRGWKDHWLVRTDAHGDTLWTRQYGTPQDDVLKGMLLLDDGDVLLYGKIDSDARHAYLARTDPAGTVRWKQEYESPTGIYGLIATRDGGYAFVSAKGLYRIDSVGTRLWDTAYDKFAGIYRLLETPSGGFVLAGDHPNLTWLQLGGVDSQGRWQWGFVDGLMESEFADMSFAATRDNGYVIVGHEAAGNDQPFVIKTDIVGKKLWSRVYGTPQPGPTSGFSVVEVTPENDLFLAGYHRWSYNRKESGGIPITRVDSEGWVVRPPEDSFWKRLRYVGGDLVGSVTIDSAGTILVGEISNGGRSLLYRSSDDGSTWQDNGGPGYRYEAMLTLSSGDIVAIHAADWTTPVPKDAIGGFRSTDHGVTWNRLDHFPTRYTFDLALSPAGDLYALGYVGAYRSSDNGVNWDSLPVPRANLNDIAIAPDGTLYVATDSAGTLRSTDRGDSWKGIGPPNVSLAGGRLGTVAVRGNGDLFVTTLRDEATYHTTDDGATWIRIDSTRVPYIRALAFAKEGAIYASSTISGPEGGTWRSTDNGITWSRMGDTTRALRPLVFDRKGRLLGGGNGIFRAEPTGSAGVSYASHQSTALAITAVPNPLSGATLLHFTLAERAHVTIRIVDRLGREIGYVLEGEKDAGEHVVEWSTDRLPAGVYYASIRAGMDMRVAPVVVVR